MPRLCSKAAAQQFLRQESLSVLRSSFSILYAALNRFRMKKCLQMPSISMAMLPIKEQQPGRMDLEQRFIPVLQSGFFKIALSMSRKAQKISAILMTDQPT
jgi:hypothetical protein